MLACTYTAENNSVLSDFNAEILVYWNGCALTVHAKVSLAFAVIMRVFSKGSGMSCLVTLIIL